MSIRWLIRRDMPEVLEIEKLCFSDFPWQEEDFMQFLRQRNCIGVIAEENNKIIGFIIYELHKSKFKILNLAVHPNFQKKGIGKSLIEYLFLKLSAERRTKIEAYIVDTNLQAQCFMRNMNFKATHIEYDYFDCGFYTKDAYHFEYILGRPFNYSKKKQFDEVCKGV